MSHEIKKYDMQESREMAWHGLSKVKKDLTLANCHLHQHLVFSDPLCDRSGKLVFPFSESEMETKTEAQAFQIMRMKDTGLPIGDPFNPTTYKPPTIVSFLETVGKATKDVDCRLDSCGTIRNRSETFLSFFIKDVARFEAGGRKFDPILSFGFGYRKSRSFFVKLTTTCIVCANTNEIVRSATGKGLDINIKLTKNSDVQIQNIPKLVDEAIGLVASFKLDFDKLYSQKVTEPQAKNWFAGFVAPEDDNQLSTRSENIINRLVGLFGDVKQGNRGLNRADMYSAVTDYYTHESAGGDNMQKQFESSDFGAGRVRKIEAMPALLNEETFVATMKRGQRAFDITDKVQKLIASAKN